MGRDDITVAASKAELRAWTSLWKGQGETIALVPTMGALHQGHLSLVEHAKATCDRTVASVFVNPRQFSPSEDFSTYPRTFEDDCAKLAAVGCDLVWAPTASAMYPEGYATTVSLGGPAEGLESEHRPHFFAGVATVCCKLFRQVEPSIAVFGEKDYQQLLVVRRMATDLDLDVTVVGRPTVREADGLAMSSRNAYLSEAERAVARALNGALQALRDAVLAGDDPAAASEHEAGRLIGAGFASVDSLTVRDAETLAPWQRDSARPARALGAAWLGRTRLIDNIPVA